MDVPEAGRPGSVVVDRAVPVRMRDGAVLLADVYRAAAGPSRPVLLQRTPYDRTDPAASVVTQALDPLRAVEAGFAVVIQDVRGRFGSEGRFTPFEHEADDGEDTIAWASRQSFCDGRVVMYGMSYVGAAALLAAGRTPPPLVAAMPQLTTGDFWTRWTRRGGALELGFLLYWTVGWLAPDALARAAVEDATGSRRLADALEALADDPLTAFRLPHDDVASRLRTLAPYYGAWLEHQTRDAFWRAIAATERPEAVTVPMLHVAGWHDLFLGGSLAAYRELRARAGTAAARDGQRLIIGPWAHGALGEALGDEWFGRGASRAALDLERIQLQFAAASLRGEPPPGPPVRLFVTGANRWRDEDAWPLERSRPTRWHLRGDGSLSLAPPADESPSRFWHDPADPVPTIAGGTFLPGLEITLTAGPRDRSALHRRVDVCVFRSEPLRDPLEVTGPLRAVLWVATEPGEADVVVALSDLGPDGRAMHVADGVLRLAFRASDEQRSPPLRPGEVVRVCVDLDATSHVFASGHRLCVDVAGSCFPRFDMAQGAERASQRVFHDAARPSHIVLPVV